MTTANRTSQTGSDATYELARQSSGITLQRAVYTGAGLGLVATLLGLLTWWVRSHPFEKFDIDGLEAISEWHWPGADTTMDVIAALSNAQASALIGIATVVLLLILGHGRLAVGIGVAGVIVAGLAIIADATLGEIVGRARPVVGDDRNSFPSGHALGTTAFYGFALYLAVHHRLRVRYMAPLVLISVVVIGMSGLSRVHQQAHWPTDLVGGYLLGLIALVLVIHVHRWMGSIRWLSRPVLGRDIGAVPVKGVKLADSYASVVMLDREAGTATKIFHPPVVIRFIYWLAFQARFPYDANPSALQAARYRREVAGYVTQYRFGKNLVAPIVDISCIGGRPAIVSKLIEGEEAANDDEATKFLTEVTLLFAEAGLPIWQLNPRNPHAHTNIIRTSDGDQLIVDLESAVATPIPMRGQIRSSLRRGSFPIFDDVDFQRLHHYVDVNREDMRRVLGEDDFAKFETSIAKAEFCTQAWQGAELRIASRVIRVSYALLNWKALFIRSKSAISDADVKREAFLAKGLDTWVEEERITPERADRLKADVRS